MSGVFFGGSLSPNFELFLENYCVSLRYKKITNYINNENMLKELVTHNWIRKNPILASYIAFAKGILLTVLIYEFIINKTT